MRRLAQLALIGLALTLAACSKKAADTGPTCAQVVDNMMAVTKQQFPGHGNVEVQNRQQMIDACEQRALTVEQKKCLATVKTFNAIKECTPSSKPPATPSAAP